MIDAQVVTFIFVAAVVTVIPGLDTMLVVRNVLRGSRRDGVVTTFGISSGVFVHALLSALGVSVLLLHSATAFRLVKFAGAGYLIWLGIQSLVAARRGAYASTPTVLDSAANTISRRRCLAEGFFSNVLNPKVAVFYLAFLPQFIGPADPVLQKSLLLAGIHFVEGVVWLVIVSFAVDRTRQLFLRATMRRWLDGLCGILFVGIGVRLVLDEH